MLLAPRDGHSEQGCCFLRVTPNVFKLPLPDTAVLVLSMILDKVSPV